jgi:UDP-N-acetylglucosamine--N-acetylmuramyl-(pentapeptide) pyrophosphoryl-undecaprenol N-acetylglucosamine transferase
MADTKVILFAGGGTGGHLFPGIAVAQALLARDPAIIPVFLCTTRPIDAAILEPTGFQFVPQPIVPPTRSIGGLLKFWKSWRETKDLVRDVLKTRQPAAVLGLGGYAAGVGVKLAAKRNIPTAILNPDVIPGKANRYLMSFVRVVCCGFDQTIEHTPASMRSKLRTTGCPIRRQLFPLPPRQDAAARLRLDASQRTLVITGASQGARTVNEGVVEALRQVRRDGWQILHLTGKDHAEAVRADYAQHSIAAHVIDFTDRMGDVWAVADLCVSRSGASTCAELTAAGVPSILLPYPFHKDMHQRANAQVLVNAGAALLVDDEKDRKKNADALRPVLGELMSDAAARNTMSENARKLGKPDAAERVADQLLGLL